MPGTPPLKPNHPNHSNAPPMSTKGMLLAGVSCGFDIKTT